MAKSASVVIVWRNSVLVKPAGKERFKLVGGKKESGESPRDTVVREAAEETGICLDPARLEPIFATEEHRFFFCRLDQEPILAQNRSYFWITLRELKRKSFSWWAYWKPVRIVKAKLLELA